VPKKTGIDKITQIEDYDLFDYDREVQPILNVLLSKTVEQALLEVEEETELDEIRRFKNGAYKRQSEEREGWEQEVKREIARIKSQEQGPQSCQSQEGAAGPHSPEDTVPRSCQAVPQEHFLGKHGGSECSTVMEV
jgi:hypothetical protein